MSTEHPLGTMADPVELLAAAHAIGAVERVPGPDEVAEMQADTNGVELLRLACAQMLAGAVEMQLMMATGTAVDAGKNTTDVLLTASELHVGAGAESGHDQLALLVAMARRLENQLMLMVARKRRGEDELLSPLVHPALAVLSALDSVLDAAVDETSGDVAAPRAQLPKISEQLRAIADVLETMTPAEHRTS